LNEATAKLFTKANRGNAEVTIVELFQTLELPESESTLSKVMSLPSLLGSMGLKLIPSTDQGELNSVRRVVFADEGFITPEIMRSELAGPESDSLELKSSLFFDHKRAKAVAGLDPMAYRSEDVLVSSLKTVAGFLNSSGGLLFIGVDDSRRPVGIRYDYPCITNNPEKQNQDAWELSLRDLIVGRFKDGGMVNDYVEIQVLDIDAVPVARVKISPRRKLSFLQLKGEGSYVLFRRQGNRTFQVKIEDVEEFIELRRESLQ
jgi:hypothetical protein